MQDDIAEICAIMLSQVAALPPGQQADGVRAKIARLVNKYEAGCTAYEGPESGVAPGDDPIVDLLEAEAADVPFEAPLPE